MLASRVRCRLSGQAVRDYDPAGVHILQEEPKGWDQAEAFGKTVPRNVLGSADSTLY